MPPAAPAAPDARDPQRLREAVAPLCPDVPAQALEDFLTRMDGEYFAREPLERIAQHVRMAAELRPGRPARLSLSEPAQGQLDVAVVAYDFFAEFAIVCGLLSAAGLDIVSGHVHTFADAPASAPPARGARRRPVPTAARKIVDVFRVRPRDGRQPQAEALEATLNELLLVSRRDSSRIDSEDERDRLRLAVALIKQFTHFLPWAPDPALALKDFDQLLDRLLAYGPDAIGLFSSPEGLRELAGLLGSSAFLWEDFLRMQFDHLLPVLGSWRARELRPRAELQRDLHLRLHRCADDEASKVALPAFKDEELIVAREEGFFHVDLRLRPHGKKGPLATPLDALRDYYRPGGGAAPFERQALLKLRPVAGDPELGRAVEAARDAFCFSAEPWDRLLPVAESEEWGLLARRLGYLGRGWGEAASAFAVDLQRHRDAVRELFERLFGSAGGASD